jgi:hypothetical protein
MEILKKMLSSMRRITKELQSHLDKRLLATRMSMGQQSVGDR